MGIDETKKRMEELIGEGYSEEKFQDHQEHLLVIPLEMDENPYPLTVQCLVTRVGWLKQSCMKEFI